MLCMVVWVAYELIQGYKPKINNSCRVCHIAGELMKGLMKLHYDGDKADCEQLIITRDDSFCVQIAALCHDLGQLHACMHAFSFYLISKRTWTIFSSVWWMSWWCAWWQCVDGKICIIWMHMHALWLSASLSIMSTDLLPYLRISWLSCGPTQMSCQNQ